MNAGKTTTLLQSAYNYTERGMNTLVLKPSIDDRQKNNKVSSRIGLETKAFSFSSKEDLLSIVKKVESETDLGCVLVDEAQFLTKNQVFELSEVVDKLEIPVLTYGLRTDFKGEVFEGSLSLLSWADELIEIKTICHCGKKAIMVLRVDEKGAPQMDGNQILIGGNDKYVSLCRKHFKSEGGLKKIK